MHHYALFAVFSPKPFLSPYTHISLFPQSTKQFGNSTLCFLPTHTTPYLFLYPLFLFSFFLFIVVIICYIDKFLLLLFLLYLNFLPLYSIFLILSKAFSFSLYTFIFFTHPKGFTLLLNLLYTIYSYDFSF